jgi:hypothetical protein
VAQFPIHFVAREVLFLVSCSKSRLCFPDFVSPLLGLARFSLPSIFPALVALSRSIGLRFVPQVPAPLVPAGHSDHFTARLSPMLIFLVWTPSLFPAQLVRGGLSFSCCRPCFFGVNFLPAGLRLLWRHGIDLLSRFCPSQAPICFSARECQVLLQPISLPPTEFSALGPFLVAACFPAWLERPARLDLICSHREQVLSVSFLQWEADVRLIWFFAIVILWFPTWWKFLQVEVSIVLE